MDEFVGDLRLRADVVSLSNTATLRIFEGKINDIRLHLRLMGWQLEVGNEVKANGSESVIGKVLTCMNLDDQIVVAVDGKEVCRVDVAPADPNRDRTRIEWSGSGTIEFGSFAIDRDVHYCKAGFLNPKMFEIYQDAQADQASADPAKRNRGAKSLREMRMVAAQMRGVPIAQLTKGQEYQPWGYSAATAITAPANGYLMFGDNSPLSWDSRGWGWVPTVNLRGHALAVVFPFNRFKLIK
jgi:hypothetical protein